MNLLTIGLSCFSYKQEVPNDIGENHLYTPPENLNYKEYLDTKIIWTTNQKMKINQTKNIKKKTMIFNYTNN